MAQISGVEVQNITSMYGVDVTSIVSIGGIATSTIPGWPTGASCTTVLYGYTDGRKFPPEDACILEQLPYDWDDANQILYLGGGCGNNELIAPDGYYSDGTTIYEWSRGKFGEYGTCGPAPYEGPWVSNIATDDTMGMNSQYPQENLISIYTSDPLMSSIIPSFNGEIWGFSIETSTDGGGSYGTPTYYCGTGSPVASPMDLFAYDKGGNPFTNFYFTGYGTNQPWSNRLIIDSIVSKTPYYGPQPYPNRLFTGQYYRQRIYPFWQDLGSFYETIFSAGDNSTPLSVSSQTNYYNGIPNM
jgi:hypothetical protein